MKEVHYLGHILSEKGIAPDPEKVRAIKELRPPKSVREVRSVVGMTSYYRKFIDHFSEIIRPLTELTKKNVHFCWKEEHDTAFNLLKGKLTRAPVLAHPVLGKPYRLYADTSLYAIGAVLTQEHATGERVIQYLSEKLSEGQRNGQPLREKLMQLYSQLISFGILFLDLISLCILITSPCIHCSQLKECSHSMLGYHVRGIWLPDRIQETLTKHTSRYVVQNNSW